MHGLGSSQNYYLPVALELIKHGFRCITFDNTGAARSTHYPEERHDIDSLSHDIIGILDRLDVKNAVVIGHSMGGIVAANLAATRSDIFEASIWIGPVYPSANAASIFEKRVEAVNKEGMEAMANTIPYAAVAAKAPGIVRAMIRELLLGQSVEGYTSNCKVIANAKVPEYAKISTPVLLIAGDEDESAPMEGVKKMFAETGTEEGRKKLIVLEGVGHWHCIEAPEAVAKHIIMFYNYVIVDGKH